MNKKLQLLTVHDFFHHQSIGRHSLFKQTIAQLKRQHVYLDTLRIRRPDVLHTFVQIIDNAMLPKVNIDNWLITSKYALSQTFDRIVADGNRWNGHGVTEKTLIKPLNDICHHSLYAMLCLDLLSDDAPSLGLTVSDVDVRPFMERIVEDVSSFSKEKFGVCPEIQIKGEMDLSMVSPFIEFVTVEVVKNSIKAVIDRYGALDIDDAPPIQIILINNLTKNGGIGRIVFSDHGIGMQKEVADR
jgi:hypothetical protein